ncbi:hypothetical protein [Chryseobacterium sp.]|uniref:hypothetical protein n=1 Tax=Chryseobacterium sp. TaxID=1871047 RepID=UPI0028A1D291|nr:hypothetical protein [Chryseobacterium sp.]
MEDQSKKGKIQVFAKNIRGNANGTILEESRYTKNIAGGRQVQNGRSGGVNHDVNQGRRSIEDTRVITIECLDELDDGSANDGSKTNTKKGVLFNKAYRFKAKEFTNGEPKNPNNIRWTLKYTDPETGRVDENILQNKDCRGPEINLMFSSNECCGREMEVRAFIENAESEGKFPVFMHNRFRWFDGQIVENELSARISSPWLINQSGTSLCGMACIFYLFAKEKPQEYTVFTKNLFRKGTATFNHYTVKPTEELLEKKIDNTGYPENTRNMPLADFIALAATRNSDNNGYKGGDEEFQAINWPPLMTELTEKLLGYSEVFSDGVYNPIKKPNDFPLPIVWKMIEDINKQISEGHRLILMIDSDLIAPDPDTIWNLFALEYHWVVLETPIETIQNLDGNGKIFYTLNFKVYTWGTKNKYLQNVISMNHFKRNYYGYIKAK